MSNRRKITRTTVGANGGLIESLYHAGSKYQWGREIPINSAEAEATKVLFTVDYHTARERNTFRRAVVDNGCGIRESDFPEFINRIGAESKDPKFGGHQGIGMKVSSIGFNAFGVVVGSRTVEDGQIMAVLARDEEHEMGLVEFDGFDEDGHYFREEKVLPTQMLYTDVKAGTVFDPKLDPATGEILIAESDLIDPETGEILVHKGEQIGTDWDKVINEIFESIGDPETGVVVIFLGEDGTEDTILGDPHRDEATKYGLIAFLRRRFFALPETIEIKVDTFSQMGVGDDEEVIETRYSSAETRKRCTWPRKFRDTSNILKEDGTPYLTKGGAVVPRAGSTRIIRPLQERMYKTKTPAGLDPFRSRGSVEVTSLDGIKCTIDWVITNHIKPDNARTDENFGGLHGVILGVGVAGSMGIEEVLDIALLGESHHRFSAYGIDHPAAQAQLFLLERPAIYKKADRAAGQEMEPGVYMDMSRSGLLAESKTRVDASLEKVRQEWGDDFQSPGKMPDEIRLLIDDAWSKAIGDETQVDAKTLERIGQEMGDLLSLEELVATRGGSKRIEIASRRRVHKRTGPGRHRTPSRKPGTGAEAPVGPESDSPDAVPAEPKRKDVKLPRVLWEHGGSTLWTTGSPGAPAPELVFVRLPDGSPGNQYGTVVLKGYAPGVAVEARATDWEDTESGIIRTAVLDAQKDYDAHRAALVEQKVKEAYAVCAQTVVGHLLINGGYDPATRKWSPRSGAPSSFYEDLLEKRVDLLSVILYGYYPQKRIAGSFLGGIGRKIGGIAKKMGGPKGKATARKRTTKRVPVHVPSVSGSVEPGDLTEGGAKVRDLLAKFAAPTS